MGADVVEIGGTGIPPSKCVPKLILGLKYDTGATCWNLGTDCAPYTSLLLSPPCCSNFKIWFLMAAPGGPVNKPLNIVNSTSPQMTPGIIFLTTSLFINTVRDIVLHWRSDFNLECSTTLVFLSRCPNFRAESNQDTENLERAQTTSRFNLDVLVLIIKPWIASQMEENPRVALNPECMPTFWAIIVIEESTSSNIRFIFTTNFSVISSSWFRPLCCRFHWLLKFSAVISSFSINFDHSIVLSSLFCEILRYFSFWTSLSTLANCIFFRGKTNNSVFDISFTRAPGRLESYNVIHSLLIKALHTWFQYS